MGEIENIRIRERKKIEDARIAIITLGDSSTLPDAKRNKLEQTIRAALTALQAPINQELLDALKADNERCESNFNVLEQKLKDYSKAIDRLLAENEALKAELNEQIKVNNSTATRELKQINEIHRLKAELTRLRLFHD